MQCAFVDRWYYPFWVFAGDLTVLTVRVWFVEPEYMEDPDDEPERDVPSLFGALGLVKKAPGRKRAGTFYI